MKLFLRPKLPSKIKQEPPARNKIVGLTEPAGARELAEEEAMLAGTDPIVKVKLAVCDPEVIATALSPESAAPVHDQFPEPSAVAETAWLPTVPETLAPAVVIPENVGVDDVTQNCFAPWIKVAPPTEETSPDPARTVFTVMKSEKTTRLTRAERRLANGAAII